MENQKNSETPTIEEEIFILETRIHALQEVLAGRRAVSDPESVPPLLSQLQKELAQLKEKQTTPPSSLS